MSDYDVEADPRHNVKGHAASRDLVERPESLLPLIAEKISTQLGAHLRAAIEQGMQESALRAFAKVGGGGFSARKSGS